MKIKRIILLTVVLMIAITSLSMVSAGWFDANQNDNKPIPTELSCRVLSGNTSVDFQINYNDSQSKSQQTKGIVFYNLTDEDGNVVSGNTTVDISSHDDKVDLPGISGKKYVISAYFPGNDKYAPSSLKNFTVVVPGTISSSSSSSGSSGSSSSGENPFEDFHTDPSTSIDSLAQHDFSQ